MRQVFSAWFMIAFVVVGSFIGTYTAVQAWHKTGAPTEDTLFNGKWTLAYDHAFAEKIPVFDTARDIWGIVDYALFRQGRKGVVIGTDGWLFTDEEFTAWPHADREIAARLDYMVEVRRQLEEKGVKLAIALIPAKARLYQDHLGVNRWPAQHSATYEKALAAAQNAGIPAPDLRTVFARASNRDELFLRTDTHWSPAGARLAARTVAESVMASWPDIPGKDPVFATQISKTQEHRGDLTRYVPLGPLTGRIGPRADRLDLMATERKAGVAHDEAASDALFGGEEIPIVLVGTSYSANKNWNFDGFLKESLRADVLNAADEGRGPFVTMENYLASAGFKETPPRLIVWEIPERYLAMPRLNEQKSKE